MIKFQIGDEKLNFSIDTKSISFDVADLKKTFSTEADKVDFDISSENPSFAPDLFYSTGSVPVPSYRGEYVVTPKTSQQVLNTAGYKMLDNVTVKKITYAETSNQYGVTAWIGEE